jgi:predicted DNA-binding protein
MTTMVSLRLSAEQAKRLTALASRHGMTRSEWLRNAVEQQMAAAEAAIDSHALYLSVTAALPGMPGSGRGHDAREHSKVLKQQLHVGHRR